MANMLALPGVWMAKTTMIEVISQEVEGRDDQWPYLEGGW